MTTPPSEPPPEEKPKSTERRGGRFVRDRVEDAVTSELEPQPNEKPQPKGWRRHVTRMRVIIGFIVGALITTFTIVEGVFGIFPGLKPDEPCPREHDATVTELTLDQSVTRGEALILQRASTEGVPAARLAQPGKLVSVDLRAKGFEDEPLQVRTWVLRAAGGPAADPELRDQLALEFRPAGCDDPLHVQVWSPTPRLAGEYRIEVQLLAPDRRTILDTERTDVFAVEGTGPA